MSCSKSLEFSFSLLLFPSKDFYERFSLLLSIFLHRSLTREIGAHTTRIDPLAHAQPWTAGFFVA